MSALMTDSKVLQNLLFSGSAPDDTMLQGYIDQLKQCAFHALTLRVTHGYMMDKAQKEQLQEMETALVEAWKLLSDLGNDFSDLIEAHFSKK